MFKILLAEDDYSLRRLLSKNLSLGGYEVIECSDGMEALKQFETVAFDMLITDIMMPRMDGNILVNKIKMQKKDFPIIMLTALGTIEDKAKSFNLGADDYVTKPVDFEELLLRIKALLRRYNVVSEKILVHKDLRLDYNKQTLRIRNKEVALTKKEFMLLFKLASNPGYIYSREQLLNEIWGYDSSSMDRTIDVHVTKLRDKVDSENIDIVSIRGLGYKVVLK